MVGIEPRGTHTASGQHLGPHGDGALLGGELVPDQVVDGELDGLLGGDSDQLRDQASVQAADALKPHHLSAIRPCWGPRHMPGKTSCGKGKYGTQ